MSEYTDNNAWEFTPADPGYTKRDAFRETLAARYPNLETHVFWASETYGEASVSLSTRTTPEGGGVYGQDLADFDYINPDWVLLDEIAADLSA